MLKFIVSRIYFFLPAYIANMSPPLAAKFKIFEFLNKPIDNDKKFKDLPILGSHKTWRGVLVEIINGTLTAYLQAYLYNFSFFKNISLFNYQEKNILFFGLLISSGAILGDLFSASIKRRLNLKPGSKFIPWDQINYVIGNAFLLSFFPEFNLKLFSWLILAFLTFFIHIVFNRIGYYLGLHNAKW